MAGLEPTSHPDAAARPAEAGRMRHAPSENLPRHRHDEAFAAIVLSGGYVEAGDTGRHRCEPGDVVLHRACEQHLDRFDRAGAEVLVLPLPLVWSAPAHGRIADPDRLAHLAERDIEAAVESLLTQMEAKPSSPSDWPDLLAQALRADPALCLSAWSHQAGLHLGSVSRGFRQVFGVTPAAYRLAQRAQHAIDALLRTDTPLSAIAHDCGFADQAHMSRAVLRVANLTPGALRRSGPISRPRT